MSEGIRPTGQDPTAPDPGAAAPSERRDRTHYLYVAVIVAMVAGILVGWLFPEVGKSLKPLGTGFVNLIKMMITPIIFCTIVLGIGSVRKAAQVGKVGGLALAFFALTHRLLGHRVTQEAELAGLDSSEMGSAAYPPG